MAKERVPDIDSHIGVQLRYAYQRATANLTDAVRDLGLTPMQVSVLARLRERGPTTQNRLGRSLAMEPANVRAVVQRLHRRGLVALDQTPRDRRALLVSLTDAGEELLTELWPRAEAANRRTLSRLTAPERRTLIELLSALAGEPDDETEVLRALPVAGQLRSEAVSSAATRATRRPARS